MEGKQGCNLLIQSAASSALKLLASLESLVLSRDPVLIERSRPLTLEYRHAIELIQARSCELAAIFAFSRVAAYGRHLTAVQERIREVSTDLVIWQIFTREEVQPLQEAFSTLCEYYNTILDKPYNAESEPIKREWSPKEFWPFYHAILNEMCVVKPTHFDDMSRAIDNYNDTEIPARIAIAECRVQADRSKLSKKYGLDHDTIVRDDQILRRPRIERPPDHWSLLFYTKDPTRPPMCGCRKSSCKYCSEHSVLDN